MKLLILIILLSVNMKADELPKSTPLERSDVKERIVFVDTDYPIMIPLPWDAICGGWKEKYKWLGETQ